MKKIQLTEQEYIKLSEKYNLIPVCRQLMADTETPVTIFQKMQPLNPVYLLESVEGSELTARYSFVGLNPFASFESTGLNTKYTIDGKESFLMGKPLDILEDILSQFICLEFSHLPRFYGGAVGYIGYDVISTLENLPTSVEDDLQLPDTSLVFCETVLIYDHFKHLLTAVVNSRVTSDASGDYKRAENTLNEIENLLYRNTTMELPVAPSVGKLESNCSKEQFKNAVNLAKEYITAGDIFQVVLSQRFSCDYVGSSFDVYRHMRSINPSPYMYYLKLSDICIAGASPEMLVRVENNEVQNRPIAGTRPRGKNADQDNWLMNDLLNDEKEKAEHVMLVDLGRNDVGNVCKPGTVKVSSFMQVEKYSHVMHLVSNVKGVLSSEHTPMDALRACFPAGTVSGAPKIRAMEIIDELETTKRGPYAGAIGYFGFNNVIDTAITLRTVVFYNNKAYFQAGGGIVADSDPQAEYQESVNKAAVVVRSLGITEEKGETMRFAVGDR